MQGSLFKEVNKFTMQDPLFKEVNKFTMQGPLFRGKQVHNAGLIV